MTREEYREIVDALDAAEAATGVPYRFEEGGRHTKVFFGRQIVAVLSRGRAGSNPRGARNTIADIRRWARHHRKSNVCLEAPATT